MTTATTDSTIQMLAQRYGEASSPSARSTSTRTTWVLESTMSGTVEQAIEVEGESFGERGGRIEVPCVDVIEVRDGRVATKHTYLDSMTMQRQLGGE